MEPIVSMDRESYEAFLALRPEVNFLQSCQWGDVHSDLGGVSIRSGVRKDGVVVAAWTALVKNARRGRYLEIPGGPVMDWTDRALVQQVVRQIRQTAREQKCVFVRFRPQWQHSDEFTVTLKRLGARKAPMHLHAEHTNILDITGSEDELLTGMRQQTRYEVRRVGKRGVEIESRPPTEADMNDFYDIQAETARRHGFVQSSRQFFHALREQFGDDLRLYRATKDGTLLNLALVMRYGKEVDYYEAASTPEARKEPGAYGIIWQAIVDAKQRGGERLNLWGIAYSDDPEHRYAGVTTFKRGFGGQNVEYAPAHDIVIRPVRYVANWIIETVRRKRRGL